MKTTKWILNKFKSIDTERLRKHVDIIAQNNHKSKTYVYFDMIKSFISTGCGYTDYFRGDFINLTKDQKKTFVTAKTFHNLLQYLNDPKYEVILHDKVIFNKYFNEYIKRDYIDLRLVSQKEFKDFVEKKKAVFVKVPTGEGGHDVKKVELENEDLNKLYDKLKKEKFYLVEEPIVQCKELNEINPNVVNSFRIITLYKDGKVKIINTALRVNQTCDSVIGSTNDLYFSLDESGKISSNVIDDYGNVYEEHPLTGAKFADVVIPGVKESFDMCKEAAMKLPQVRYIGWDVAFSNKGPVIVEGNEYPGYGLVQHYRLHDSKYGHLKEISDFLGDEMKNIKL